MRTSLPIRLSELTSALVQRFHRYTSPPDARGCVNWTGPTNRDGGYGRLFARRFLGAHRVAWMLANGTDSCDNPLCVNAEHISLGTQHDNVRDMVAKGRRYNSAGQWSGRAKLTEADVVAIREAIRDGATNEQIATRYGVTNSNVSHIATGRSWRTAPGPLTRRVNSAANSPISAEAA